MEISANASTNRKKSTAWGRRCRAALLLAVAPLSASADTLIWNAGSGSWSNPSNWAQNTIPGAGDDVQILSNDGINHVVTYDFSGSPLTLNSLQLNNTGTGFSSVQQSTGRLSVTNEYIGITGQGGFIQSGGLNQSQDLFLADNASGHSTGLFSLSGGTVIASAAHIGGDYNSAGGTGILNISGGSFTAGSLKVYDTPQSVINLSGGLLAVGFLDLSNDPSRLNWTGGTLNLTASNLSVGTNGVLGSSITLSGNQSLGVAGTTTVTSGASLTLNGGTLTTSSLNLSNNPALLHWNTGTLNLTNSDLTIGSDGLLGSSLTLSTNQTLAISGLTSVNSDSVLTLDGGSLSTGALYLSGDPTNLVWNAGALKLTNSDLTVGNGGLLGTTLNLTSNKALAISGVTTIDLGSTITLNGGTLTAGTLALSDWSQLAFNRGTLNLQGGGTTNGTALTIGIGGLGTLNFTNGVLNAPAVSLGGSSAGSVGVLNVSGGVFNVAGELLVGSAPGNLVNLTGGTLAVGSLNLSGNNDRLHWSAGTLALTNSDLTVGPTGWIGSTLDLPATKSLTVSGATVISPSAVVNLSGGVLTTGTLNLSGSTSGLNWTLGTLNLTNSDLSIGSNGLLGSAPNLTGGKSLGISGATSIALGSTFTLNGGTFSTGSLNVANWSQLVFNSGTLSYSNGATTNSGTLSIGTSTGPATLNQNGGQYGAGSLLVGNTGIGTFNLSQGTFSTPGVTVGNVNTGGIGNVQVGGTLNVGNTLKIANTGASGLSIVGGAVSANVLDITDWSRLDFQSGTLNLTSGTTASVQSGTLKIGIYGPAAVNQNGGANAATILHVGYSSAGSYILQNSASLTIGQDAFIGHQLGSSSFNQLGGNNSVGGRLLIGAGNGNATNLSLPTGANLDGTIDYGSAHAYTDTFNIFRFPKDPTDNSAKPRDDGVDANGNLLGNWTSQSYLNGYQNGIYKLSYTGAGELTVSGMGHIVAGSEQRVGNTVTADVQITHDNPDGTGGVVNLFANGNTAGNLISNVHLLAPGYTLGQQIYTNDFIKRSSLFTNLRFMDWGGVNYSTVSSWNQRVLPTEPQTSTRGTAYENQIALANATGKDIWINIPLLATDDYIRQMADLFHAGLTSNAKIHVELSNEVWNGAFTQFSQNYQNAQNNPALTDTDGYGRAAQQYALRAAQASQIFQTEFGTSSNRVQFVLGGQNQNTYWADEGLKYVKQTLGDPSKYFTAVAIAPYFADDASKIAPLGTNSNAIFNEIFREINGYLATAIHDASTDAAKYGLKLYAYEGGDSLPATITQGTAFLTQLQNDPRMYQAIQALFAKWTANGGDLFNNFSHIGPFWGLLLDSTLPGSQKWDATLARVLSTGDANLDNAVNYSDFLVLKSNFSRTGQFWEQGDFNHDGVVDLADLSLMKPYMTGLKIDQAIDIASLVNLQIGTAAVGGVYSLASGNLSVTSDEYVGYQGGVGVFNQTGGTHSVGGTLYIGDGIGSYSLSNTGTLTVTGDEYVGYQGGIGLFNQSGGTHTVGGNLYVGGATGTNASSTIGSYTLSGNGKLSVATDEYIGTQNGIGIFSQTGGTHTVGGTLYIGSGGTGSYTLGGGTLNAKSVAIGDSTTGNGSFSLLGGQLNVTNTIKIWNPASTFTVRGGSVSASLVDVNGTLAGSGTLSAPVSINVGGTIAPSGVSGTSTTGLLVTGAHTWHGGGTYAWKINDAQGTAGANVGWDQIQIPTLSVIAGAGNGGAFTVRPTAMLNAGNGLTNFSDSNAYRWIIARVNSGVIDITNLVLDTTNLSNSHIGHGGNAFSLAEVPNGSGSDLEIVYDPSVTAVPEPGSLTIVLVGLIPGLLGRRRRRSRA